MKNHTLSGWAIALLSLAIASTIPAQAPPAEAAAPEPEVASEKAASVGMLPHQKHGTPLDDKERNPFAERVVKEASVASADTNSEESRIRGVLSTMLVSGASRSDSGAITALFGGISLKEGIEMPQLIDGQTDILKVTKITEKDIEIKWVDVEGTEQPRKHVIPVNLEPWITMKLPSADGESNGLLTKVDPRIEEKRAMGEGAALSSRSDNPSPAE